MSVLLVQIFGGIFGLTIAWLINYYYTMHEEKTEEQLRIQHKQELDRYKNELKKSVK